MTSPKKQLDDPPQPPPFQRRIRIAPLQAVGVSLLAAIVIAALAGVFGQKPGDARVSGSGMEVQVSYPQILRYKTAMPLEISVRNTGSGALSAVELRLDRAYLDAFQDVRLTPDPDAISEQHYTLKLKDVPPGESRTVVAWLEGNERGRRDAKLQVAAPAGSPLDLDWTTTVLP